MLSCPTRRNDAIGEWPASHVVTWFVGRDGRWVDGVGTVDGARSTLVHARRQAEHLDMSNNAAGRMYVRAKASATAEASILSVGFALCSKDCTLL
jgi:hypothetical protein